MSCVVFVLIGVVQGAGELGYMNDFELNFVIILTLNRIYLKMLSFTLNYLEVKLTFSLILINFSYINLIILTV